MSKNNVKQLLDTIYHLIYIQGVNHPLRLVNVSTIGAFEDVENTKDEFALADDFDIDTYKTACNVLMYSISEVASGLTFDKRKSFFKLLDSIQNNKIKRVVITHKNRLSRVSFSLFENIFKHHGTEIVVISDIEDEKTDNEEIFEEIISLLKCFNMRMYSKRRKEIKKVLDETGANTKTDTLKQRQTK